MATVAAATLPSPTPSPGDTTLPDGCVTTDSGDIACGIITDSYLAVFVDCPASLSGPEDCELCDVISLIGDTTPGTFEKVRKCFWVNSICFS
jgi:hypothetical protein